MSIVFAPGVSACRADRRLVVLSLPLDRYLMLPAASEAALARQIGGDPPAPSDGAALEPLSALGLIEPAAEGDRPVLFELAPPTRSFIERPWPPPPRRRVLGAARAVLTAMAALRWRTLASTIAAVRAIAPEENPEADRALAAAAAFAELRIAVRTLDRCLPLSLALARAAKRHDPAVRLVLGVACNPFAAHAWVQREDLLLNDRLDSIAAFTPILAV